MGINWQGMLAAGGASVSNLAQVAISAEVQKQRDANMARYSQQSQQAQFAQQDKLQTQQLGAQGLIAERKLMAEQQAGALKREQEVADATLEHKRGQADIVLRARLDPSGTNITTNIDNGQDLDARTEEFSKAIGKADADMYANVRKSAQSAAQMEDSLSVLEKVQSQFETGKTQQAMATLGQYVGTDAGAAMQAWEGTISPIVLAKAEGLSGVLSDKDMEFLKASVPQFGLDKKANAIMIGLMRKGMQRAIENEKSMQNHINTYGNLNDWTAPNQQGSMVNSTPQAQTNMGAADDPLGLFK